MRVGTTVTSEAVPSARSRDVVTAVLGAWLIVGLFLDGYMHNTRGDALESFVTPWHAVLYSGFLAVAVWIMWPIRQGDASDLWSRIKALPEGYALGAIGVLIFAVGGLADAVWHGVFGIEVGLEALLSAPHLVLLTGAMLIVTTPVRAAWHRGHEAPDARDFAPALVSLLLATSLVGFFFMYLSGLYDFHATANFAGLFDSGGEFEQLPFLWEVLAGLGVAARLITTVILMVPVLLLLRRWTPPAGTFSVFFGLYGIFMLVLDEFRMPEMVVAMLLAGITADVITAKMSGTSEQRRVALRLLAAVVPAVLWSAHFAVLAVTDNLGWPFALWGGVVLFSAGTGYVLSLLAVPPRGAAGARAGV